MQCLLLSLASIQWLSSATVSSHPACSKRRDYWFRVYISLCMWWESIAVLSCRRESCSVRVWRAEYCHALLGCVVVKRRVLQCRAPAVCVESLYVCTVFVAESIAVQYVSVCEPPVLQCNVCVVSCESIAVCVSQCVMLRVLDPKCCWFTCCMARSTTTWSNLHHCSSYMETNAAAGCLCDSVLAKEFIMSPITLISNRRSSMARYKLVSTKALRESWRRYSISCFTTMQGNHGSSSDCQRLSQERPSSSAYRQSHRKTRADVEHLGYH